MVYHLIPTGDGHTELNDEDRIGLIPTYISTRGELFEAEQRNIADALLRRAATTTLILDDKYLRDLHKAMFGQVWKWAGRYRQVETDIGIAPPEIGPEIRKLTQDAAAWIEYGTFGKLEIVVRFHHRLVQIHPFPNGNGRWGRVAADMLWVAEGGGQLSWGALVDLDTGELRTRYINALRAADGGHMSELMDFATS